MTELSDEARALFDAARSAHEPSGHDRQQVRQSVLLRVGAVAAASSLTRAGSGATAGAGTTTAGVWAGKIVAAKVVLGLALMGSVGTGAYYVTRSPAEGSRAPQAKRCTQCELPPAKESRATDGERPRIASNPQPPPIAPERNSKVAPAAKPSPEPAIASRRHHSEALDRAVATGSNEPPPQIGSARAVSAFPMDTAPVAPATAAPPEVQPSSGLTLEAQGLSLVQQALRDGRGTDALALLDLQERTFHGGKLDLERQAARIIALCAVGRQAEARAFAIRFLARAPNSFLAARVRNTCAGP